MYEVIKAQDARFLYAPAIFMNFINAFLWTMYGLVALGDPVVWAPNAVGLIFSSTQLVLVLMFSRGRLMDSLLGHLHAEHLKEASSKKQSMKLAKLSSKSPSAKRPREYEYDRDEELAVSNPMLATVTSSPESKQTKISVYTELPSISNSNSMIE